MRNYVRLQTAALLKGFAKQIDHAAEAPAADSIHDLRVSIRRLSRCLRVFAQFYPSGSWKPVRRRLSRIMDAAGAVRDRDIALELLAAAGVSSGAPVVVRLQTERSESARALRAAVSRFKNRNVAEDWKERLGL